MNELFILMRITVLCCFGYQTTTNRTISRFGVAPEKFLVQFCFPFDVISRFFVPVLLLGALFLKVISERVEICHRNTQLFSLEPHHVVLILIANY